MKESESLEQNRIRQLRLRGISRKAVPVATTATVVKLSPARKTEPAGLLEEHFPNSEAHTVSLEYFDPTARDVLVAGTFNDWQ